MPTHESSCCDGTRFSGAYMAIRSRLGFDNFRVSPNRIKCLSSKAPIILSYCSQRLPQLRAPWAEWHKKDIAGQWTTIISNAHPPAQRPTCRIRHSTSDVLAYSLVGRRPRGHPPTKVPRGISLLGQDATRFACTSTESSGSLHYVAPRERHGGVGPRRGFTAVGARLYSSTALGVWSARPHGPVHPQELLCTPHVPQLSLAVWTAPGTRDTPTSRSGREVTLGSFLPDDGPTHVQPDLRLDPLGKSCKNWLMRTQWRLTYRRNSRRPPPLHHLVLTTRSCVA